MASNFKLDDLDKQILVELQKDSRKPFQEISRDLIVSGGTVHVRVNKMKEEGIIKGSRIIVDPIRLGYNVCAYIGINLHNAGDTTQVIEQLKNMGEIVEAHYTTGSYSLFIKVLAKNIQNLHHFLIEKLQTITQIQSTETLISLDSIIEREVPIP